MNTMTTTQLLDLVSRGNKLAAVELARRAAESNSKAVL